MDTLLKKHTKKHMYKILDLFSGLGGFSLGLERTGHFKTIAFCDNDKFSKLILDKHWKGVKIYDNVKEISKEKFVADGIQFPDIITGGFPCQPFSVAGKQKGTSDDRYLWPEMFRIIKAFKPKFIIGENVRGIINIQDGVVFETVCTDLESEGYEVQPFIIPAAGVGAPHRRERVWIIANLVNSEHNGSPTSTIEGSFAASSDNNEKGQNETSEFEGTGGSRDSKDVADTEQQSSNNFTNSRGDIEIKKERSKTKSTDGGGGRGDVANSIEKRLQGHGKLLSSVHQQDTRGNFNESSSSQKNVADTTSKRLEGQLRSELQGTRERFTNSSQTINRNVANSERIGQQGSRKPIRSSDTKTNQIRQTSRFNDGSEREQGWWHTEPDVGRVAYGIPGRVHRLKGLGNSIVPQIAEEIGRAIIKAEKKGGHYE
jgi:DNA (cytosine-5)-methyltransferase 1